jgi:hypothetical protein
MLGSGTAWDLCTSWERVDVSARRWFRFEVKIGDGTTHNVAMRICTRDDHGQL